MKTVVILFSFIFWTEGLKCRSEENEESQIEFQDALQRCMANDFSEIGNQNERQNWNQNRAGDKNYGSSGNPSERGRGQANEYNPINERGRGQVNEYNDDFVDKQGGGSRNRNRDGTNRAESNRQNHGPQHQFEGYFDDNNDKRNVNNLSKQNNSYLQQMNPCIVHCIFRQMQMLDSKSVPDKESIISVMTQSIRDLEVKDFIEETVEDCFDKMNTTENRRDKCQISKSIAVCLETKGKMACDDW